MKPVSTLDQVREARRRISERFGHDPKRLIEHYIKLQERHRNRLVSFASPGSTSKSR